jgi:hypothetical protein
MQNQINDVDAAPLQLPAQLLPMLARAVVITTLTETLRVYLCDEYLCLPSLFCFSIIIFFFFLFLVVFVPELAVLWLYCQVLYYLSHVTHCNHLYLPRHSSLFLDLVQTIAYVNQSTLRFSLYLSPWSLCFRSVLHCL